MVTDNINLDSVSGPCFAGVSINVRLFALMLMAVVLLLPSTVQADGLFDFQMKLAKKGNAEAQYKVGEMYETGFGVKQDKKQAMSWITKADKQGHETAGFKLLYWDVEKNGINKTNKAKVETLITKAKKDKPQAQYYLGKMHAYGVGVKKDLDKAISWLNKAALVGVLEAEREIVVVRENRQRQVSAENKTKRRAELKARQEQQRKLQAQKQAKEKSKQNKAAADDARVKADKKAVEEARLLAQKKADEKRREAQKQALLKKRAEKGKKRKVQFESDPCSGKSARFLSTCK